MLRGMPWPGKIGVRSNGPYVVSRYRNDEAALAIKNVRAAARVPRDMLRLRRESKSRGIFWIRKDERDLQDSKPQ